MMDVNTLHHLLWNAYEIIGEQCPHILTEDPRGIEIQQYAPYFETKFNSEKVKDK